MPPEFTTVFVALLLQDAEIPECAPAVSQSDCWAVLVGIEILASPVPGPKRSTPPELVTLLLNTLLQESLIADDRPAVSQAEAWVLLVGIEILCAATGCVTKAAIVVVATNIAATATIESILLDVVRFVILSSYID
jgi:hypothetical protein